MAIDDVLRALNEHKIRATYGAVGQYLGVPAIAVSRLLGARRPEASWVVSAKSGRPTGYGLHECHRDLQSSPDILRSGEQLLPLISAQSNSDDSAEKNDDLRRIAGIDLAWQTQCNGSGIAIGTLSGNILTVEELHVGVVRLENVIRILEAASSLVGVAVDAPLIIDNHYGPRPCETELNDVYRSKWAGCYPANLSLYPDAMSVRLGNHLSESGFAHLGDAAHGKWQVECYPHPVLIELFGLDKRLAYKKGTADQKRTGQARLARLIKQLRERPRLSLRIPKKHSNIIDEQRISNLKGQALKDNEDGLDALLCLYVAGLYALNSEFKTFGSTDGGYIAVPISE
jgi:predicted RNase H-like nuclease